MAKRSKVSVDPQKLAFALRFVSREESRPVLHSVFFRAREQAIIATDGRAGIRYTNAHEFETDTAIVFPSYVRGKANGAELAHLEYLDGERWLITLTHKKGQDGFLCRQGAAEYPDFDAVIPDGDGCPLKSIAANPSLLKRFERALANGVVWTFYGAEKAIRATVSGDEDFVGLVMPVRALEPIE